MGATVLLLGLALLIFTFASAFLFLNESLQIIAGGDLGESFGGALSPLIVTCIRVMYLGVMGWIGSLITIRGITILFRYPENKTVTSEKSERQEPEKTAKT
ncbi:MAG: hypothetical protein ACE14S_06980 [Candidatus Bathyarchaeia archaeon]